MTPLSLMAVAVLTAVPGGTLSAVAASGGPGRVAGWSGAGAGLRIGRRLRHAARLRPTSLPRHHHARELKHQEGGQTGGAGRLALYQSMLARLAAEAA